MMAKMIMETDSVSVSACLRSVLFREGGMLKERWVKNEEAEDHATARGGGEQPTISKPDSKDWCTEAKGIRH